jgi:hypothetical protein
MNNKKDSEIAWISIQDKINKEWNSNNAKKEEDKKVVNFKAAVRRLQKKKTFIR